MALAVVSPDSGQRDEDAPAPVDQAGPLLNHAILLAEILGFDAAPALATIDAVADQPEGMAQLFAADDQDVMEELLARLDAALRAAVDASGRPTGSDAAATLAASEHVRTEQDGALVIRSRSMHLADVRTAVARLLEIFRFARRNERLVRLD
jgi:hypothetical protein